MSKAVNTKWKKTFPDTIGNQNRPATGVDDTQPFETGAFPQYMSNDPVRYDLQNAAMSQSMSNDARLKEMVDARGKELDDHKVDPGAHKTGIAGNAATATKVVTNAASGASANIAEASMAGNDVARIRVSGANNAGELALETADDGTEPIVARQYTGVFKDVARTASILDTNGNTSFPGTVVAPKFTGALNGNAATASKLATPRTLSLTGKAAGSTSFDGSANASINVTSVNADTASKLSTARKINITGNATGAANFDGSGDANISVTVNNSNHSAAADTLKSSAATETSTVARPVWLSWEGDNTKQTVSPNLTYTCSTKTLTAANFKGHLAGNADTATKATQDANGNNIPSTYVKSVVNLTTEDLNNVCKGGFYQNSLNVNSTSARHYPVDSHACSIIVANNGVNGENSCTQICTLFDTHDSYKREYEASTKTWSSWRKYAFVDSTVAKASQLATARTISLTGNASGSAIFDGSGNVSINTTVNESKHAVNADMLEITTNRPTDANVQYGDSKIRYFLATGNMSKNKPPTGDGKIINLAWDNNGGWDSQLCVNNNTGRLNMRGQNGGKWSDWLIGLDSGNFNEYAPTKTGGGASGTWPISISGNAATATRATTAAKADGLTSNLVFPDIGDVGTSNKISWNGSTDGADIYYQTTASNQGNLVLNLRDDANCYLRIAYNGAFKSYFSPSDGNFHGNVNGNADTATNADKLDGYHTSDLFRHLGGNQTPVITDIFDRAGTIDMTTMSAADKATHKANINKASNASQNIWNTSIGIHAYGGDYDIAGYNRGTLKLTQSYKNFDKILVVGVNDKGELLIYKLWDVWALANAFASGSWFQLFHGGDYWFLYGSTRKGTRTDYALSTDTVWSCQDQNSGIVAIYGIKY